MEEILTVRDHVFKKNIDTIDEYRKKNPDNLNNEELEILKTWIQAIVCDKAILFKHTKENSLFLVKDKVYGVKGLMDPFNKIFEGHAPLFMDIIILPFKDILVHEGLLIPYSISFGKSMEKGILAEAEEIVLKKGVIKKLNQESKEVSDEDLLRFYMKSERNQDKFFEEIDRLRKKTPELEATYNYEIGRINARHIKKQLKSQNMKGHFAILFSQVIASGLTKNQMEDNLRKIISEDKMKEVYVIRI